MADRLRGRSRQLRREQARGTRGSDAHRGRAQKPAAILVDCFGGLARVHGALLGSIGVLGCTCVLPNTYRREGRNRPLCVVRRC